jgi:magnesium-transporting ATPase (P-type)
MEGMVLAADGYVVVSTDVETDESALTGETDHIRKNTLSQCLKERAKKFPRYNEERPKDVSHHELSSPILLSGT